MTSLSQTFPCAAARLSSKVLLGLHKAPYLKHNDHGLLSTGQAQEYSMWVDDTLPRHGGGQRIAGQDGHGTS